MCRDSTETDVSKLSILVLLALTACGPTKKNFAGNLTEISCQRLEECAKGAFDALYTSVDDCVARAGGDAETSSDCMSGHCDFDKDNASQCLDRVESADCDEIVDLSAYSDCAEVWTNCDGDELQCVTGGTTSGDDSGT